jgi:Flp pilus assembly protein TadD
MGIVLAAGFAAAVSISLVALYVALRRQPERKPAEAPSVAAPAPARPPAPREPTIVLASIPVPASADQLKQESAFVAAALRERFPSLAQALHVVAMLHAQLRQSAEAEKLWRKCMELDPTNETYYVNVAAVAMDRGGSETAVETLERAIAAGCASRDIDYHLALGLMNLGRCDEAKAVMQKTLATYPNSSPCWVVLGQVQLKLGEAAEAEVSLRKSMNLGPPSASLYFALANACARQGKNDEAAKFRTLFNDLKGKQPVAAPERFQVLTTAEARRTAVAIHCEAATVHAWHGDFLEAEMRKRAGAWPPCTGGRRWPPRNRSSGADWSRSSHATRNTIWIWQACRDNSGKQNRPKRS